jgi:hypothetical protein
LFKRNECMLLDAPALKARVTSEVALSIVQKSLVKKGWRNASVSEFHLVYTPYWVFSFDIVAEKGASPTGKTGLNAYTGELNDLIPAILERPVKKSRETEKGMKPEIEPTAVSYREVKETAATKIAAHVGGIKPENVSVSAVNKLYVPFYRVWVDVAGDTHKFEVDGALGVPMGLEVVPGKPKGWEDETGEALGKLKSPSGWMDLFTRLFSFKGGESPVQRYAVLGLIILALAFFVFVAPSRGGVECKPYKEYYSPAQWFGLVKESLRPEYYAGKYVLEGECFVNRDFEEGDVIMAQVFVKDASKTEFFLALNVTMLSPANTEEFPKPFHLEWEEDVDSYLFGFERV